MGLGDPLDDRQAETDPRVAGARAPGAALERLRQRGHQLRAELLAGVLDHGRGSTVDLTLYDLATGELVEMGGYHDLMDSVSTVPQLSGRTPGR